MTEVYSRSINGDHNLCQGRGWCMSVCAWGGGGGLLTIQRNKFKIKIN